MLNIETETVIEISIELAPFQWLFELNLKNNNNPAPCVYEMLLISRLQQQYDNI